MEIGNVAVLTRHQRAMGNNIELDEHKFPGNRVFFQLFGLERKTSVHELYIAFDIRMRLFFTPFGNSSHVTRIGLIMRIEDEYRFSQSRKKQAVSRIPFSERGLLKPAESPSVVDIMEIRKEMLFRKPVPFSELWLGKDIQPLKRVYMQYRFVMAKTKSERWREKRNGSMSGEDSCYALEGERYKAERELVRRREVLVRQARTRYFPRCEACGSDMEEIYGELGRGYVQYHHRKPLGGLPEPVLNSYQDLAPLCPNCHTMIHRTKPVMCVSEFKVDVLGG